MALIFGVLVAGILIGTVIDSQVDAAPESSEPVSDATPLQIPAANPVDNQFSEIARQARPSVVSILIPAERESVDSEARGPMADPENFFRRFFGFPDGPGEIPQIPQPPRRRAPGQGSGVIVDSKGYILTNEHVVRGASKIVVQFVDDTERYPAKLIGVDAETDLAVIHVENKDGLQAARIGNSDAANVGDWAIAIGSPFGYNETVTVGIISAKAREMETGMRSRPFLKFIQTDAAINPGNSGGPLLNSRGEVIGVNTAIISRTGGYDGIGFAVASNIVVKTYNQIIRYGRVSRGSIGVEFSSDQSPSLLRSYGAESGVFVGRVVDDGPAEDAGMKAEDIITRVNGKAIKDGDELIAVVSEIPVGETVPIDIVRDGKAISLDVTIADRGQLYPELTEARLDDSDPEEVTVRFGVTVQDLSPERRSEMRLDEEGGVLLTKVEPDSFAQKVGLEPGDVLLEVNREAVRSTDDLRTIQKNLKPGMDVAFKLLRSNGRSWRTLYLAEKLPD